MSDSDDEHAPEEQPTLVDDDPMRAFLPASFGKKAKQADIAAQIDRTRRVVPQIKAEKVQHDAEPQVSKPKPKPKPKPEPEPDDSDDGHHDSADDSDGSDDSDDSDDPEDDYPVSHELVLKTHGKAVTTVSLDPAGGRLVTGSYDCLVKLHDFASMTPTTLRAYKSVDPWETKKSAASSDSHPINHVQFSPLSGGVFLCVSAHPQAKIMSRDGGILTEFVKGDMYLRDMHHTKGHIGEISTGAWCPTDKSLCVTAGSDSTLRIWDVDNKRSQRDVIVFKSKAAGNAGRTKMTAVAWASPVQGGSNVLVAAALDGSLVMYSGNGPWTRPTAEVRDAHKPDTYTGGIDVSSDGRMVVTRGGDDLIKLWDTRKFKEPVVAVSHASTSDRFRMTNIKYSPNSTSIVTGSADGSLHILNPGTLRPELVTPVTPGSPIIVVDWHAKLNQILTGSANAETHVLYSPTRSTRGAVEVMMRAPKKRHIDDNPALTMDQSIGISADSIVTPGASAGSRRAGVTASGRSLDPRRPHVPKQTPFSKNQPDERHIEENIPLSRMLHEDPREALLKYADIAKKDPMFTSAWKNTQPVTQYADASDGEDADDGGGPERKKARR